MAVLDKCVALLFSLFGIVFFCVVLFDSISRSVQKGGGFHFSMHGGTAKKFDSSFEVPGSFGAVPYALLRTRRHAIWHGGLQRAEMAVQERPERFESSTSSHNASRSALTKIVKKRNSCSARNTLFVEFQQVVSGTQNALSGTQSFVTCLGDCRETDGLPKELHV